MQRRTDFFYEMEPGDKMGFPPGVAEKMVYSYFKNYQDQHFKRFPHKPDLEDRWKAYSQAQKEKKQVGETAAKVEAAPKEEAKPVKEGEKAEEEEEKRPAAEKDVPIKKPEPPQKEVAPPKMKSDL